MSQLITMIHISNVDLIEHYRSRLPSNLQGAEHKPYWCVSATTEQLSLLEDGEVPLAYNVNQLAMLEGGTEDEPIFTLPEVDMTDGNVYEMPLSMFRLYKAKDGVFDAPEPEPFVERYQTKRIDPRDFREYLESLGLLTPVYRAAHAMEEAGSDEGRKWIDHESAGTIDIAHVQLVDGMTNLVASGIWDQASMDLVSKGIPYSFLDRNK